MDMQREVTCWMVFVISVEATTTLCPKMKLKKEFDKQVSCANSSRLLWTKHNTFNCQHSNKYLQSGSPQTKGQAESEGRSKKLGAAQVANDMMWLG